MCDLQLVKETRFILERQVKKLVKYDMDKIYTQQTKYMFQFIICDFLCNCYLLVNPIFLIFFQITLVITVVIVNNFIFLLNYLVLLNFTELLNSL